MKKKLQRGLWIILLFVTFSQNNLVFSDDTKFDINNVSVGEDDTSSTSYSIEKMTNDSTMLGDNVSNADEGELLSSSSSIEDVEGTIESIENSQSVFGEPIPFEKYLTVKNISKEKIYLNLDLKEVLTNENIENRTFFAKEQFENQEGSKFLSLYTSEKAFIGYIENTNLMLSDNEEGIAEDLNQYVSIPSLDSIIYKNFSFEGLFLASELENKTFYANKKYYHFNGKTYVVLNNHNSEFVGIIEESKIKVVDNQKNFNANNSKETYGKFITVNGLYPIWESLDFENSKSSIDYQNKTLEARYVIEISDDEVYFEIYDHKKKLGYIDKEGVDVSLGPQGPYYEFWKYVTLDGSYPIWSDFEWKNSHSSSMYKNQTLQARGVYNHFNGSRYYSLYDNQGKWLGYVNEGGAKQGSGAQGAYQEFWKYVTLDGSYPIWSDFEWKNSHSSSMYKNQTLQARGVYNHFNGSRYYSLYDNQGKWLGYVNEGGAKQGSGAQGAYQEFWKYVTLDGSYPIWSDFEWKNSHSSSMYKNQTLQARGVYNHFNGSRYYSLYDNQGKWLGYVNEGGAKQGSGAQGAYQEFWKYVTLDGSYPIWSDFEWKNSHSSSMYKNQTLQARGVYNHFNGSRYYSLYDNQGKWLGYVNEGGAKQASGPQGSYQVYNKHVSINSDVYKIWRDFKWEKKAVGVFLGETYLAKGVYHHFNGSRYLSLYDAKDNWIGYINEKGTKLGQSQADKFKKVQELLNKEYNSKNFGIYVASLVDGSVAQINGEQQFHAASTGKLPALYYTQKMILDKKVDGNYPYTYTDAINQMPNAYMRGGAGVLQGQPYGKKFSLNTIMNWTAKYSDNQGTNFLAYYAANKYDATMKKEISRIMGRNWTAPFYVNAKDNAKMLEAIYHQGGKLITDLSNTVYDDQRIPKYLPVQVAHKIGDVEDLRHDAGIVYSKNPYTLSILTKNYQSYEQISILSKKIYDIMK